MFYYFSIDTFKDIMVILMCLLVKALGYSLYAQWVNFLSISQEIIGAKNDVQPAMWIDQRPLPVLSSPSLIVDLRLTLNF